MKQTLSEDLRLDDLFPEGEYSHGGRQFGGGGRGGVRGGGGDNGFGDHDDGHGTGTRWVRGWQRLLLVVGLLVMTGVGLPTLAIVTAVSLASSLSSREERIAEKLESIPGIAQVEESQSRTGDLGSGANIFFTVDADSTLTADAEQQLIADISHQIAHSTGGTRVMVELRLGDVSVGISPATALNPQRLQLARDLAALDGVSQVTVLWHTPGDDLITDDTNDSLQVTVQASEGSLNNLVARAVPLTNSMGVRVTAVVLGSNPQREHLWSWGSGGGAHRGERSVTSGVDDARSAETADMVTQLDASAAVTGYDLDTYDPTIALVAGSDPGQFVAALRTPSWWSRVTILVPAGDDGWTTKRFPLASQLPR
jgi:hypothetical protein